MMVALIQDLSLDLLESRVNLCIAQYTPETRDEERIQIQLACFSNSGLPFIIFILKGLTFCD